MISRAFPVTVNIYDVYAPLYRAGQEHPTTATRRGIRQAVAAAEARYAEQHGGVRADGALQYFVYLELPLISLPLPERVWLAYSQQTAASLRQRRAADQRQWA